MISKDKGTLIVAIVLAAFGIFWMVAAKLIRVLGESDAAGPQFFPFWAAACLTLICFLLIIASVRVGRQAGGASQKEGGAKGDSRKDDEPKPEYWRTCGAVGSLLLFILLLDHLHFFLNTFMISTVGMALGGEPLKPRLVLYALIVSGIVYGIFVILLQIPLPGSRYR